MDGLCKEKCISPVRIENLQLKEFPEDIDNKNKTRMNLHP